MHSFLVGDQIDVYSFRKVPLARGRDLEEACERSRLAKTHEARHAFAYDDVL